MLVGAVRAACEKTRENRGSDAVLVDHQRAGSTSRRRE
jgi:hypothetical protein